AHECAHEFFVDERRDGRNIDPRILEEHPRILGAIDARRLDGNIRESGGAQQLAILVLLERTGDAADPQLDTPADLRRNVAAHDDVGYREAPSRLQDAEGFAKNAALVGGEIDHAVRDDDVDGLIRKGNRFDLALEELDVRRACFGRVPPRELQHVAGHVESVGLPLRTDAARRQQHVDASARSEIEHRLARLQLGERSRIAAAERGEHRRFRHDALLRVAIEIGGHRIAVATAATASDLARGDAPRRFTVLLFHHVLDHFAAPYIFVNANMYSSDTFVKPNVLQIEEWNSSSKLWPTVRACAC